ncbi:hypothetical protein VTO42DRAFT_1660 [Malbranchea cinnamomea]
METFQLRLNCIDHYQANPSDLDPQVPLSDGSHPPKARPKFPIIRVFGATETGQKVCAHVHGALPYLYVEYKGDLAPAEVDSSIRSLHLSIDHALAASYRRNAYDPANLFVAHVSLVKGIPFYGYHVGYRFFFKIYLLNPQHMTRLADLLRQGAVMKRVLQPYESHLQYVPQWMCDYNLHGCDYLKCSKVRFRDPVPSFSELDNPNHRWHDQSIPQEMISDSVQFPRQSHCALEVDIHVRDILNRHEIKERPLHHDFIEKLCPFSSDEKLVPSLAGLWEDEKRRRKAKLKMKDTDSSPFTPADLISMSADPRRTGPDGWVHEQEFRRMVEKACNEEDLKYGHNQPSFRDFVKASTLEPTVRSALQSVEDLYPENLQAEQSARQKLLKLSRVDIDIDEGLIQSSRFDGDLSETEEQMNGSFLQSVDAIDEQELGEQDQQDDTEHDPGIPLKDILSPRGEDQVDVLGAQLGLPESTGLNTLGVKKREELLESEADAFDIGDEFISEMKLDTWRKHLLPPKSERPRKRLKTMTELNGPAHAQLQPNGQVDPFTRFLSSGAAVAKATEQSSQPSSSQKALAKGSDGNQRLLFHVVKDPNGPVTLLRLSQQSQATKSSETQSSTKATQPSVRAQIHERQNLSDVRVFLDYGSQNLLPRNLHRYFDNLHDGAMYSFIPRCPSTAEMRRTINDGSRPSAVYQAAFYSDDSDVPDRPRVYAGREFRLEGNTVPFLPPFDPTGNSPAIWGEKPSVILDRQKLEQQNDNLRRTCSLRVWEFAPTLPSRAEVIKWFNESNKNTASRNLVMRKADGFGLSQIDGPTQENKYGFKYTQKKESANVQYETSYMSVMSLEVHVNTRGTLAPNPEEDEISCIFWCIQTNAGNLGDSDASSDFHAGVIALCHESSISDKVSRGLDVEFEEEATEIDVITRLVDIVRHYDPDILTGYEVHNSSWGYLIERARFKFDYDLCDELSRVKIESHGRFGRDNDRWGFNHTSTIRVTGRHMINIWRAMRGELNLLQYTMENVVFHLLHRRIPHYPFQDLTQWWTSGKPRDKAKVMKYFISRVKLDLQILEANELISRTSEQARILGIDFYSVFSRGSQFKVESLMFRIAKPENFILISPSKKQVGQQNALECLPLVMEPQSDFYTSPLLVLDFQSLYPSIMIAYNYCYSTCLGRIIDWRGRNKLGFIDYQRQEGLMSLLRDKIIIAPNGLMYTKPEIRKSLLARMLTEILETRVMVKNGMKEDKDDKMLQRLLNNRQLALKFVANVTYGYTSASFSGRMPCAEIADSIVQTARETLEKAIALIHSVERWGAEVVYGDTDSLFIYLKGRTRDEAFDIGEDIARTVTNANPRPVKLKFEKVYHPCVLLAKKRYVGYMYESRSQTKPHFDAKGIETVRRDGTPAEQKIEEKALRILFETADLSRVKRYFQKQCAKIMQGKVSIQDFCFAKEVRLGTYSDRGQPPPGALISAKRMLVDPRLEPQYGERVPYVVVSGAPGARLIDRCVSPDVLLKDAHMELDAEYYITKNIIPPLERIFNLVGANVRQWYDEMPKYQRMRRIEGTIIPSSKDAIPVKKTLESYMKSSSCVVCREKLESEQPVCPSCRRQPHQSLMRVKYALARAEKKALDVQRVCRSCMGVAWGDEVKCDSKDCPVFYTRTRSDSDFRNTQALFEPVISILEEESEEAEERVDDSLIW